MNKRIPWIDTVKYLCIICVMAHHLESVTYVLDAFYLPFYLTAFFFVSGYTYTQDADFRSFFYKKVRCLFVPWLVFSILNIMLSQILSFNDHGGMLAEMGWNFLQIRGRGDGVWFVAALFVAYIPFYFFIMWSRKLIDFGGGGCSRDWIVIGISFLLSLISIVYGRMMNPELFPWKSNALPWHLEYVFVAMFFMVLGYCFKHRYEKFFDRNNTELNRVVCLIIYLLLVYIPCFSGIRFPTAVDIFYQYLCQFAGIACVVSLAKVIKTNRYISYVGQNTLICFALHGKCYSLIQTILKRFVGGAYTMILSNTALSSLFALFFSLGLSVILIIPVYIINRWLPFLLGRKKHSL